MTSPPTPRDYALRYFAEQRIESPKFMPIEEFDRLVDSDQFIDGPFKSQFGSGYGEPYNPVRQVFGKLKTGEGVFSELVPLQRSRKR